MASCALLAIVYGLQDTEKWNHRFNPGIPANEPAGASNWLTVAGLAIALFAGTTVLLASIAFTFQRYFEFELDPSQALDAPALKKPAN
jgi:multisubunit Na+/H+ antiporter MnhB subunit